MFCAGRENRPKAVRRFQRAEMEGSFGAGILKECAGGFEIAVLLRSELLRFKRIR